MSPQACLTFSCRDCEAVFREPCAIAEIPAVVDRAHAAGWSLAGGFWRCPVHAPRKAEVT